MRSRRNRADDPARPEDEGVVILSETRSAVVHTLLAQERDRADLADVLHEQPVQLLTAVGIRLGTLARAGGNTGTITEELQDRIDVAIAQLRKLMKTLRGSELDDGLVDAVRREIEDLQRRHPEVATSIDHGELEALPTLPAGTVCFRVAHAALITLNRDHVPTRVLIKLAGTSESTRCAIRITTDASETLRDALLIRLREWVEVIELLGGSTSIREEGAAVSVEFEMPADL